MLPTTCLVIGFLLLGLGLSAYLIAADPKRFFIRFGLEDWKPGRYQSLLSNFLQATRDRGLPAWPKRLNALSAFWFSLRIRGILRSGPAFHNTNFLHNHLQLAVLLRMLKPFIEDYFLAAQAETVVSRLLTMGDTADRDRLRVFVERASESRRAFQARLTVLDLQVQAHLRHIHFFATLSHIHAIFTEHGYSLLPQFDNMRRWESLEGSELVQELPKFTKPADIPSWPGLVLHAHN